MTGQRDFLGESVEILIHPDDGAAAGIVGGERVIVRVRGHEKVPTGGQVEVPAGGQIKVPTPCSSCRSGTAGPGSDGEGANHTPPPPGSSIEVCEGPHGHHFCLSTSRVVPRGRRAVRYHPQD